MYRLALHGGQFSGKSTLAEHLERQGFGYVNYTRMLKEIAVAALNSIGIAVTVEQLEGEFKEKYRKFVIETGTVIGFDQGYGINEFVLPALERQGTKRVVFDNVRFPEQMDKLVPAGFRLVRIVTPMEVREKRAIERGYGTERWRQALAEHTEVALPPYPGEIQLVVDGPMEQVLDDLAQKLADIELFERRTLAG